MSDQPIYWYFRMERYYPKGGTDDLVTVHSDIEGAKKAAVTDPYAAKYECALTIVEVTGNLPTRKWVYQQDPERLKAGLMWVEYTGSIVPTEGV